MTKLCELFAKYGADKYGYHSYSEEYFLLLEPYSKKFVNILEIGVGTKQLMSTIIGSNYEVGASLKAWRDFFVSADIFGLDIEPQVLFEEERIKCFYTDQSHKNELEKTISEIKHYKNNPELNFDLIIDDGSHVVEHMITSFKTLNKYLNINGIYIIEDIKNKEIELFSKLETDDLKLIKKYQGLWEWDSFVAYQRLK